MHVVIVMDEGLNDAGRPRKTHVRPDEHKFCACPNEAVYEVLGASSCDLSRFAGSALAPVSTRVVDVHIQSVLVRRMAKPSEALPEIATVRSTEVTDAHPRYVTIFRGVSTEDTQDDPNQAIGSVTTIRSIRR